MKTIQWKVALIDGKLATMEEATGLPQAEIESHLTIIGILENLKQKHLDKLKTLYDKTVKTNNETETDL